MDRKDIMYLVISAIVLALIVGLTSSMPVPTYRQAASDEQTTTAMVTTETTAEAMTSTIATSAVDMTTASETTTDVQTTADPMQVVRDNSNAMHLASLDKFGFWQNQSGFLSKLGAGDFSIGEADFFDKLQTGLDGTLLDFRSKAAYDAGHITGAVNVPDQEAFSSLLSKIPADKPVFTYSKTGALSGQAAGILNGIGFDAKSINAGFDNDLSKLSIADDYITKDASTLGDDITTLDANVKDKFNAFFSGIDFDEANADNGFSWPAAQLASRLGNADDFQLVSLQSAANYTQGHIAGALNIPFAADVIDQLKALPAEQSLVLYDEDNSQAPAVAATLRMMGRKAIVLNGGLKQAEGWLATGQALVSGDSANSTDNTTVGDANESTGDSKADSSTETDSNQQNATASDDDDSATATIPADYVVKSGDTLLAIGNTYGIDWQQIARINAIANPNLIYPGQKLKLK